MGHCGEFIIKILLNGFNYLFDIFVVVFHHKICVFVIFISFFDEVSNFRNRLLTNQKHEFVASYCQCRCITRNFLGQGSFHRIRALR